jgi:4-phosphopantoate--beta-alanine ligase
MGKVVISVDLNPLSRTSVAATVPIVDEVTRALANVARFSRALQERSGQAERILRTYDRAGNLAAVYAFLRWRLANLVRASPKRPRGRGSER